jgi:hypothetical protein
MSIITLEPSYTISELIKAAGSASWTHKVTFLVDRINHSLQTSPGLDLLDRLIRRVLCRYCIASEKRVDDTRDALTEALLEAIKRFAAGRQSLQSESHRNIFNPPIDLRAFANARSETCVGHECPGTRCTQTISRGIRSWIKEEVMIFWVFHFDNWVEMVWEGLDRRTSKTLERACRRSIMDQTDNNWTRWPEIRSYMPKRARREKQVKDGPGERKEEDGPGFLYAFQDKGIPGHIKIGMSVNVEKRMKNIYSKCGRKPKVVKDPDQRQVRHVHEAEQSIFAELSKFRRRILCLGCGSSHAEWFEIDEKMALEAIERARQAMEGQYGCCAMNEKVTGSL